MSAGVDDPANEVPAGLCLDRFETAVARRGMRHESAERRGATPGKLLIQPPGVTGFRRDGADDAGTGLVPTPVDRAERPMRWTWAVPPADSAR